MARTVSQGRSTATRALFFMLIVAGFVLAVFWRLYDIQVARAERYTEKALHLTARTAYIPARRGDILDRNGDKLATSIEMRKIVANPQQIENPERAAQLIARILDLDERKLAKAFSSQRSYYLVAEKVPIEKAIQIAELRLRGIFLRTDYKRVYPYGSLCSPLLGYLALKTDDQLATDTAQAGIELAYNDLLAGRPGYITGQFDEKGMLIPETEVERVDPLDGLNLVLTIDREIQYVAEQELKAAIERHQATCGTVIVMDPTNGDILALANYPSYDPNAYFKVKDYGCMLNRAVAMTYEPGSTLKALTVAAALDEGVVAPDTPLYLPEKLKVGKHTIGEAHHRAAGTYTVTQILEHSYNVGAVRIAQILGAEKLYERLRAFGLGEKTGIDLAREQSGYVPSLEAWAPTTFANIPFGQGLTVTPLQMLRAVAAFANDGIMQTPHLMKYSEDPSTSNKHFWEPDPGRKVVSRQTAEAMTRLLTKVVDEGTGVEARIPGYSVAGKTGTAQMANPEGRGYLRGHYVASFVGYAPATKPAFAMIVVIVDPKNGYYGGQVAAPVFREVGKAVLQKLRIPPDRPQEQTSATADVKQKVKPAD